MYNTFVFSIYLILLNLHKKKTIKHQGGKNQLTARWQANKQQMLTGVEGKIYVS